MSSLQLEVVEVRSASMSLKILAKAVASTAVLIAACAPANASSVVYTDGLKAFQDVCIAPATHAEILRAARATGWRRLEGDAAPALVRGNGMVDLQDLRQGEVGGSPVLIAVGDLGGASFCRIYFRPVAPAAMIQRLSAGSVLGAPLGQSDFDGPLNDPAGWKATGWHVSRQSQWRAVHYSYDPDGQGPNAAWQSIEITRAIRPVKIKGPPAFS
jgi:hypothetical protein